MSLMLRNQWVSYMDCGESYGTHDYKLIGEGFTSFPESKNPKKYTRKYSEANTEQTDVISYAPSISYSCDAIIDDPVVRKIIRISDEERIGVETHVDIVSVNMWDETCRVGAYVAYKRTFSIVPSGKGEGTGALIYTGTMYSAGDAIRGTFDTVSNTFTADEPEGEEDVPDTPIALCQKNVAPSYEEQHIAPDAGYYGLSSVVIEAMPTTYILYSDGGSEIVCEIAEEE